MIKISNICKSFGEITVLNGISFEVGRGEIFSLLSENGGGKTTLMRILMGLIPSDSGEVCICGSQVSSGSVKGIGYMPEERGLYLDEKVWDQLRYFALLHKVSHVEEKINSVLRILDVEQYSNSKVKHLSLGNKQRVQIAAALIHEPEVLILDEPFSGLDPVSVERFISLLKEYAREGGTILFSSHQVDIVDRISDRLGIMEDGKMVFVGESSTLKLQSGLTTVQVHAVLEAGRSIEDLDFSCCPSVHAWNGLTLTLNTGYITVKELLRSGLKTSEIRGFDYQKKPLVQVLEKIYDGSEG